MENVKKTGHLFVISGASGTGKTTLSRELIKEMGLFFSVSATTRQPRMGEVLGYDYYFFSPTEFDQMIQEGQFLEWAVVHGNYYGTPLKPIEQHLKYGEDVLLDLDTQGALHLKKLKPETVLIFLKPPSLEDLRKRLQSRGTDSAEAIERRIERARLELEQSPLYDFEVVNRNLPEAKEELKQIIDQVRKR